MTGKGPWQPTAIQHVHSGLPCCLWVGAGRLPLHIVLHLLWVLQGMRIYLPPLDLNFFDKFLSVVRVLLCQLELCVGGGGGGGGHGSLLQGHGQFTEPLEFNQKVAQDASPICWAKLLQYRMLP